MRFGLNFSGDLDSLGETLNINLYRIVQESVTNALRYAQATAIDIAMIRTEDGVLHLTVSDNGIGMNLCLVDQTRHFGLLGIRERAQALHGQFSLDSIPDQGTQVSVIIPTGGKR